LRLGGGGHRRGGRCGSGRRLGAALQLGDACRQAVDQLHAAFEAFLERLQALGLRIGMRRGNARRAQAGGDQSAKNLGGVHH
jgi:hypothetical protein